jgi:hypothetical protein
MKKVCKDCQQELIVQRFYRHPDSRDGRFSNCIDCMTKRRKSKAVSRFRFKIGDSLIIRHTRGLHRGPHTVAVVTKAGRNPLAHDTEGIGHVVDFNEVKEVMREGSRVFGREV